MHQCKCKFYKRQGTRVRKLNKAWKQQHKHSKRQGPGTRDHLKQLDRTNRTTHAHTRHPCHQSHRRQ